VRDASWANLGLAGERARVDTRYRICETQRCCRFSSNRAELCVPCRSGGIGRRAWFRSTYSQGCGGSSPFFGTKTIEIIDYKQYPDSTLAWVEATRYCGTLPNRFLSLPRLFFACNWTPRQITVGLLMTDAKQIPVESNDRLTSGSSETHLVQSDYWSGLPVAANCGWIRGCGCNSPVRCMALVSLDGALQGFSIEQTPPPAQTVPCRCSYRPSGRFNPKAAQRTPGAIQIVEFKNSPECQFCQ
jgi:hypothetical protein